MPCLTGILGHNPTALGFPTVRLLLERKPLNRKWWQVVPAGRHWGFWSFREFRHSGYALSIREQGQGLKLETSTRQRRRLLGGVYSMAIFNGFYSKVVSQDINIKRYMRCAISK